MKACLHPQPAKVDLDKRGPAPGCGPELANSYEIRSLQKHAEFGGNPKEWTGWQVRANLASSCRTRGMPMDKLHQVAKKLMPIEAEQIPDAHKQANIGLCSETEQGPAKPLHFASFAVVARQAAGECRSYKLLFAKNMHTFRRCFNPTRTSGTQVLTDITSARACATRVVACRGALPPRATHSPPAFTNPRYKWRRPLYTRIPARLPPRPPCVRRRRDPPPLLTFSTSPSRSRATLPTQCGGIAPQEHTPRGHTAGTHPEPQPHLDRHEPPRMRPIEWIAAAPATTSLAMTQRPTPPPFTPTPQPPVPHSRTCLASCRD